MYQEPLTKLQELKYVLERLNKEAVAELKKLFGNDYKNEAYKIIKNVKNEKFVIKLEKTKEPIGVYGLCGSNSKKTSSVGIFFLTTDNLNKGNKIKLLKGAKKQIALWETKYKLIMDSCHKDNRIVAKWLHLLGFKPSKFQDEDIQIWYKGDLNEY